MNRHVMFAIALTLASSGSAFAAESAAKSCEDLKKEIATKLDAKGVTNYTLDIVDKDQQSDGKAVGTCGGGTKKIVYTRKQAQSQA